MLVVLILTSMVNAAGPTDEFEFSSSVSIGHFGGIHQTTEPYSTLGASVGLTSVPLKPGVSFGATKLYYVDQNQEEIEVSDPTFSLSKSLADDWYGFSLGTGFGFDLPFSEYSRENGIRTVLRWRVSLGQEITDTISASYAGRFVYQVNEFKTADAGPSGRGGQPLRWFSYGGSGGISWAFRDRWSADLGGSVGEVWYEKTESTDVDAEYLPDHPYSVDVSVTRTPEPELSVTFGLSQGSRFESGGKFEFVLFDQYSNYWFISSSYSL